MLQTSATGVVGVNGVSPPPSQAGIARTRRPTHRTQDARTSSTVPGTRAPVNEARAVARHGGVT
jgi:hypothetical protein